MSLGREIQVDMGTAISAEREWLRDAKEGKSTSACSPVVNTPVQTMSLPYHDYSGVEELATPPAVVNPMKKAALQAHMRLQAKVKNNECLAKKGLQSISEPAVRNSKKMKATADKPVSMPCSPEMAAAPKLAQDVPSKAEMVHAVMVKPLLAIKDKEPEQNPEKVAETGNEKKKRRPNNGPMQAVLNAFVAAKKREGMSYREAQKLWLTSEERAAVVNSLSASERAKRRF